MDFPNGNYSGVDLTEASSLVGVDVANGSSSGMVASSCSVVGGGSSFCSMAGSVPGSVGGSGVITGSLGEDLPVVPWLSGLGI